MAVYHVVWLKFGEGVPAQRVQAHQQALRGLAAQVPGILSITGGANFTDRANGCSHGFVITLRDRQALADYAVHPRHVEVASALRQDAQVLVLDYEE